MNSRAHMPDNHKLKASIGITAGLILVFVSAVAVHLTFDLQHHQRKWAILMFASVPVGVWGCAHLARYKGYPPVAAYVLFAFGFSLGGFIVAFVRSPIGVGGMFILSILLPAAVLFVLPNKGWHPHRRRHRRIKKPSH